MNEQNFSLKHATKFILHYATQFSNHLATIYHIDICSCGMKYTSKTLYTSVHDMRLLLCISSVLLLTCFSIPSMQFEFWGHMTHQVSSSVMIRFKEASSFCYTTLTSLEHCSDVSISAVNEIIKYILSTNFSKFRFFFVPNLIQK